ncbi:acetylglutamate kinase [Candidatus Woesearchaeota archaeon]|nr:acetylglutamate kinase [Candidatus Woesearchaeota archaeon]
MKHANLIIDFFSNTGEKDQALMYLNLYTKTPAYEFAVIKIGGNILKQEIDKVADTLCYLYDLGLYPVIIHGAGPQIKAALKKNNINTKKIDGQRITGEKELGVIVSVMKNINQNLVKKINENNGKAESLTKDIFFCKKAKNKRLGFVGEIKSVNTDMIKKSIRNKKIPVVSSLGYDESGNLFNINADCAAKELILKIKPKKFILLSSPGGILNKDKKIISYINLKSEYDSLIKDKIVTEGMLLKLSQIKDLLENINYNFSVQIASPKNLIKELFTIKGSGTFIKKGIDIKVLDSFSSVDKNRLKFLLEQSFSRKLKEVYFKQKIEKIIIEENYKGAIILKKIKDNIYVDKFAVLKEFQGEGIGRDLWIYLEENQKKFFWRARPENDINTFYSKNSTGIYKAKSWHVFSKNIGPKYLKEIIEYSINKGESFV